MEIPAIAYDRDVPLPEYTNRKPSDIWPAFFQQYRPQPQIVADLVLKLDQEREHEHAISCMQSALIHGQSQPWMYELLAVTMEKANRPQAEIERVVLSLSDFGSVDYGSMMYSGAYLANFKRHAAALRMYRQGSRMLPERPEPYLLGLKQAEKLESPDDIVWAAQGIVENYWGSDYVKEHRAAQVAVAEAQRKLRQAGQGGRAEELGQLFSAALVRDVTIRLDWSGEADLDLSVTEPDGSICSFETPETTGGGLHTHDGYGPTPASCYEAYVCPRGYPGEYRLTIHNQGGKLVGNRAVVVVRQAVGTPQERVDQFTVNLAEGDATLRVDIKQGRRQQPRTVIGFLGQQIEEVKLVERPAVRGDQQRAAEAIREFNEAHFNPFSRPRQAGATGFSPVVRVLNDGTSMTAQAVVSPDRRYVRLSLNPTFSSVSDVFTFSILGGQTTQQGAGGQ